MSLETWANSQVWYTVCSREVVWPLVHKRAHRQWIFSQATSTLCFSFGSEQKSILGIWHFYGHMGCLHLNEIIRMSDWHQQMVDGAEFWISCKWLKALRKASQWKLIKFSAPSTISWRQCDIRIFTGWVELSVIRNRALLGGCFLSASRLNLFRSGKNDSFFSTWWSFSLNMSIFNHSGLISS